MPPPRPPLTPAAELLLATAALGPDGAALRRMAEGGVDWTELCALAEHERAASVVWRDVSDLAPAAEPAMQTLHALAAASAMRQLQLQKLLYETLDTLAEHGRPAMLLKGAALAHTVYPAFTERPMGDLDLLAQIRDARTIWSLLQAKGWRWPKERWAEGSYEDHQHLPPLVWEPGEFRLELHTGLLAGDHPFRLATESVWECAERARVGGREVAVASLVHQLWYVCVHFAWGHQLQWGAWRALRDCAALTRPGMIAWPQFVELARVTRAATCCYWTLRLAQRFAGATVPDDALASLRPDRSEALLNRLERHYIANLVPSSNGCPSLRLGRRLWEAGILPRQSGHGDARPWHVQQKWLAASPDAPAIRPVPLWKRLPRVPRSIGYLARLSRG